ncbi:MAG: hypothetical protein KY464_10145 [Gemmatimonadetes bacterium]|nr:hypothetical protein [Gemmatimonadota bacterium]
MRRSSAAIAILAALLRGGGTGAAQVGCDDAAVSVSPRGGSIEGYSVLFQQNGVTFYGRAATTENAPVARIMIRNGNRFPIEVSYNVLLEYRTDSLPRSLSLGRHCAQIPAGQFAMAEDAAPAPPSALRVRNLTIANLAAAQGSRGGGSAQPPAANAPAPSTVTVAPTARAPGSTASPGRSPVVVNVPAERTPSSTARGASPAAIAPGRATPAARSTVAGRTPPTALAT